MACFLPKLEEAIMGPLKARGKISAVERCPYCRASLWRSGAILRCEVCSTAHYSICWNENGFHCSVFSCAGGGYIVSKFTAGYWLIYFPTVAVVLFFMLVAFLFASFFLLGSYD